MDRTQRIALITVSIVFGIGFLFLFIVFKSLKNASEKGYNETRVAKFEYEQYVNESEYENLAFNYAYKNTHNDKIIILDYLKDYSFVVWKIDQIKKLTTDRIHITGRVDVKQEDRYTYEILPTQEEPLLVFQTKTKIEIENKLFVNICKHSQFLENSERKDEYLALKLRLSQISFNNRKESADLIISTQYLRNTCLIIVPRFNELLVFMLYPKRDKEVDMTMLKDLLKVIKT